MSGLQRGGGGARRRRDAGAASEGGPGAAEDEGAHTRPAEKTIEIKDVPDDGPDAYDAARPAPAPATVSWRMLSLATLLCPLLAAAIYSNTFEHGHALDDNAVMTNADVTGQNRLWDAFFHDYWGSHMKASISHRSYRPVSVLSLRLNYHFTGPAPEPVHITNVCLYAFDCVVFAWLCFALWARLGRRPTATIAPLLAALLYTVHPIHTEAVANIAGRAEILSGVFYHAALLLYLVAVGVQSTLGSTLLVLLSVVLGALSTLSKDSGITVFGAMALFEVVAYFPWVIEQICRFGGRPVVSLPPTPKAPTSPSAASKYDKAAAAVSAKRAALWAGVRIIVLICWVMLYFGIRVYLSGSLKVPTKTDLNNTLAPLDQPAKFMSYGFLHAYYFFLMVAPVNLLAEYTMCMPRIMDWDNPLNAAALALYSTLILSVLIAGRRNDRLFVFATGWAFGSFLPASGVFFEIATTFAERLMFVPSSGICIVVALLWQALAGCAVCTPAPSKDKLPAKAPAKKEAPARRWSVVGLATLVFVALVAAGAVGTYQRNPVWANSRALWDSVFSSCPDNPKAQYERGRQLVLAREYDNAVPMLEKSLVGVKEHHIANLYLGKAYYMLGDEQTAFDNWQRARHHNQYKHLALADLSVANAMERRPEEAEKLAMESLKIKPRHKQNAMITANLVGIRILGKNWEGAWSICEGFPKMCKEWTGRMCFKDDLWHVVPSEFHNNCAVVLAQRGSIKEAEERFFSGIQYATSDDKRADDIQLLQNNLDLLRKHPNRDAVLGSLSQYRVGLLMTDVGTFYKAVPKA